MNYSNLMNIIFDVENMDAQILRPLFHVFRKISEGWIITVGDNYCFIDPRSFFMRNQQWATLLIIFPKVYWSNLVNYWVISILQETFWLRSWLHLYFSWLVEVLIDNKKICQHDFHDLKSIKIEFLLFPNNCLLFMSSNRSFALSFCNSSHFPSLSSFDQLIVSLCIICYTDRNCQTCYSRMNWIDFLTNSRLGKIGPKVFATMFFNIS